MKQTLIIIIAAAAGAFAWWTLSPLFIDKEVNDALPTATLPVNPDPVESEVVTEPELESPNDSANQTSEPTTLQPEPIGRLYPIQDTPGHPASGDVRIVVTPDEQIVRYENYDGTNGPDLEIYLAKDLEANDFINLGPARGNKGNINYAVPPDVDIDDYQYVLTWCKAFGVLFDYALIQ